MTDPAGAGLATDMSLEQLTSELERSRKALREMSKVGMALMGERDPSTLFDLILTQSRALSNSDAGSLYLVEKDDENADVLHFIASQNDTLPHLPSPTFRLPLNEMSLAGYAATTGRPLVLEDVYELPDDVPYSFNKAAFDEKFGYRAKSMLIVPMIDHRDTCVGVLQLINRKSNVRPLGAAVHRARSGHRHVPRRPGGHGDRERAPLPGHRESLCRLHQGSGDRDRPTGSDHVGSLRARHRADV
ncbi:MAG: GAF domain-containing protein [Longimicrobiales bacterium]